MVWEIDSYNSLCVLIIECDHIDQFKNASIFRKPYIQIDFPGYYDITIFSHDNATFHKAGIVSEWLDKHEEDYCTFLSPKLRGRKSNRSSMGNGLVAA